LDATADLIRALHALEDEDRRAGRAGRGVRRAGDARDFR